MKNKDNSDENYYNVRYDNKFNKISEIGSNKFFLKIMFINVEAGLLLNIPRHDDEKAKSPYYSNSQ